LSSTPLVGVWLEVDGPSGTTSVSHYAKRVNKNLNENRRSRIYLG
jgi:hypothetical protein